MSSARRKPEDSVEGCRALEQADRLRALAMSNPQMRETFERSANAWSSRATLLEGFAASFTRAADNVESHTTPSGPGTANG
jgi:hypothetical protein